MTKKIRRIAEVVFWILLAAGNAATVLLLWMRDSGETPEQTYALLMQPSSRAPQNVKKVKGNTITLPDGTVCATDVEGERMELTLTKNRRQIRCVSDGPLWQFAGG